MGLWLKNTMYIESFLYRLFIIEWRDIGGRDQERRGIIEVNRVSVVKEDLEIQATENLEGKMITIELLNIMIIKHSLSKALK